MRLRVSTWFWLAVPLFLTTLILWPRPFFPAAWTRTTTSEYGLNAKEALQGLLLAALGLEVALSLLIVAIRAALQPTYRRDAKVISAGHGLVVFCWLAGIVIASGR